MPNWSRLSFPRIPVEQMLAIIAVTVSVSALVLSFYQADPARK